MPANEIRLQKAIADAGLASRRRAEELIASGHVTVNGSTVTQMGVKVTATDQVEVDGMPLTPADKKYFLFYKPRGVISAVTDDKNRRTVTDFFTDVAERLYPVGRLDYDTSGLLIMTNDGAFSNLLQHPKYGIDKYYVAKVQGIPTRETLAPLKAGMTLKGKPVAPARVKILSTDKAKKTAIVSLVIHQGMNHQVKEMFKAVEYPVLKLAREQYGPVTLAGMQSGDYRPLKPQEIHALKTLAVQGEGQH